MKKGKKISFIVAIALILAGAAVSIAAFAAIDGDFTRLNSAITEENIYTPEEPFDNIFMYTEFTDVEFAASEDGTCRVVLNEYKNMNTTVGIQDNTLSIKQTDNREWHEMVGIFIFEPKITVYLPEGEYQNLSMGMVNGDVKVSDQFSFQDAMVNTIRGDVDFSAAVENELTTFSEYGEIRLAGVNAKKISCKTEQRAISLVDCDADTLILSTANGNVTGILRSGKVFTVKTEYGEVNVPASSGTGTCAIFTINGDVKITVKE